jgi:hypothetical protein
MAFHWVGNSGTEPTFWKALERKKLLFCLPDSAGNLTMKVARNVFELRVVGKSLMADAMKKSIDKCKAEHYHGIDEWSLGPAATQTAPRHHEIGLFEQEGVILEDGYDGYDGYEILTSKRAIFDNFIKNYKLSNGCKKCGYDESSHTLHCHHRDPSQNFFPYPRQ